MSAQCVVASRPEDRRRQAEPPMWADTLPGWFRSEAFVEDLPAAQVLPQPRFARGERPTTGLQHQAAWAAASHVLQQTRALWFYRPE